MLLSTKNENEIPNPIAEACQKEMDSTNSEWSSFTIGEKLCGVLIPLVAIVEVLICNLAACFHRHSPEKLNYSFDDIVRLANDSAFSVNEVEALRELFKKLSSSIIDDGLIHKEELQLALFNSHARNNIFLDKVFDLFDEKQNGVIEFEEFVHVLSVFHPSASMAQKVDFAFRFYDLRQTGYIEREEVREMVLAIFVETNTFMSNEILDDIIDKTFKDADTDQDGKISKEEWEAFVFRNPTLLRNMTLPQLKDVTTAFPSFIFNTEVVD